MIEASMLIFMNPNGNYFIRDLDDSNQRICYKTCPKGWMDQTFFAEDFVEPREFPLEENNVLSSVSLCHPKRKTHNIDN